jgi:hypothetical protein
MMHKKLAVSVMTGLLLTGVPVATAQVTPSPTLVVTSYQATLDVASTVPLALGTLCIDAIAFLRQQGLVVNSIHELGNSLAVVLQTRGGSSGAILVCGPAV